MAAPEQSSSPGGVIECFYDLDASAREDVVAQVFWDTDREMGTDPAARWREAADGLMVLFTVEPDSPHAAEQNAALWASVEAARFAALDS